MEGNVWTGSINHTQCSGNAPENAEGEQLHHTKVKMAGL